MLGQSMRILKFVLIGYGILALIVLIWIGPFIYHGITLLFRRSELESRTDYAEIAAACVQVTQMNDRKDRVIEVTDSRLPELIKSLAPAYITGDKDSLTLEFAGGFDHFGYKLVPSENDPSKWTLSFYGEHYNKDLITIPRN